MNPASVVWLLTGFISFWVYQHKHRHVNHKSSWDLVLTVGLLSTINFVLSRILVVIIKLIILLITTISNGDYNVGELRLRFLWHKFLPFEFSYTITLSLFIAFIVGLVFQKLEKKVAKILNIDLRDKDPYIYFFSEQIDKKNNFVLFTTKQDKVYIGCLKRFMSDPNISARSFEIAIYVSGYRWKENGKQKTIYNTIYTENQNNLENPSTTIFRWEEVVYISEFNFELHNSLIKSGVVEYLSEKTSSNSNKGSSESN